MALHMVEDNTCRGCGNPVAPGDVVCEYCGRAVVMTSFNQVAQMAPPQFQKYKMTCQKNLTETPDDPGLNLSMGLCYLKLKLYDEAYKAFSQAMEGNFEDSEPYFYAAVSLMKGKKAFLHTRPEIDRMMELMEAAISLEERGVYYYFMAYVKYDYFKRKFLSTTPTYKDYLAMANTRGCPALDVDHLFAMMGVEKIAIV